MKGPGVSLGGSKPGRVISVSIPNPGPLGAGVENTKDGKAIISLVTPGSQAEKAGLQRGDAICFADSNGSEEIQYKLFLQMVRADDRPLVFEVRRLDSVGGTARISESQGKTKGKKVRADDEARRQAVIAAAEARDKQNKQKKKPIRKNTELSMADKKRIQEKRDQLAIKNETYMSNAPMSEEARRAVEAAKSDEVAHTNKLGYNPYETMKGTGQQASNTVTAIKHGAVDAGVPTSNTNTTQKKIVGGNIIPKSSPGAAKKTGMSSQLSEGPINPVFDDAFATLVTSNTSKDGIKKSLRILRKLIQNATAPDADESKRKVRLSNANKHIQAAVNEMDGAIDLMFSAGFMLIEDAEDETYLIYPPGEIPDWLPTGLERMERYESGL